MTVAFRFAEAEDRRFIIDGWVTSYKQSYYAGLIAMSDWRSIMWGQIEKVIDRQDVRTVVAYETEDTGHLADLYGFITADSELAPPLVYYIYVAQPYRRGGYARRLFAAVGVDPDRPFQYA